MDVILVVTTLERMLEPIAAGLAAHGYTGFAALPSVALQLQRCATFDHVVWHAESDEDVSAASTVAPGRLGAILRCAPRESRLDLALADLLVRMALDHRARKSA